MEQGLESSIAQSLLSLSKSSNAIPIRVPSAKLQQEPADSLLFADGSGGDGSLGGTSGFPAGLSGSIGAGSVGNPSALKHHRRLSSTGKTKRRLSDARDAASRPSPASLSLSGLSLNSPPHTNVPLSTSFTSAMGTSSPVNISGQAPDGLPGSVGSVSSSIPGPLGNGLPASVDTYKTILPGAVVGSAPAGTIVKPVPIAKNGKKRGMDHRCEMCNKVYRHPSCLIKHRWEHTTHWRESSKYVLSKHQQVQLLEAAAILSHFSSDSATGTSLPEDRSLWPSFLSGGALPLPEGSCSVPALTSSTRATSTGPRLHDYAISTADAVKVRPGLVVANGNAASGEQTTNVTVKGSTPIPVPNGTEVYGYGYGYGRAGSASGNSVSRGKSWGERSSSPYNTRSSGAAAAAIYEAAVRPLLPGQVVAGRSGSSELEDEEEVEDQEEEDDDVDVDVVDVDGGIAGKMRYPYEYDTGVKTGMKPMKEEEEDWEMEMDMD
ncbi:hypothetical protein AAF712_003649 [Marasmius tenuissimus]|uniref:C2H2-type domain-containing protein n=1 Tax=Marasmius tenuissimus TaxID=585030 RepID=A0ABR3A7J9_9AGAR